MFDGCEGFNRFDRLDMLKRFYDLDKLVAFEKFGNLTSLKGVED